MQFKYIFISTHICQIRNVCQELILFHLLLSLDHLSQPHGTARVSLALHNLECVCLLLTARNSIRSYHFIILTFGTHF